MMNVSENFQQNKQQLDFIRDEILPQVELQDLILILGSMDNDEYVLIYNKEPPPLATHRNCKTTSLYSLNEIDLSGFDGITVGLPEVDVAVPDISTYGPRFFPLSDIFIGNQEHLQTIQQTAYRLALSLLNHPEGILKKYQEPLDLRNQARIIRLALPELLRSRPLDNLVAVIIRGNLNEYVNNLKSCELVYNAPGEVDNLSMFFEDTFWEDVRWVITFEEISSCHKHSESRLKNFLEFRRILRQMDKTEAIRQTLLGLAHSFWRRFSTSGRMQDYQTAYTLAAEAWLMDEDVEHLVTIMPHQDFHHFVASGDALRIYRVPILNSTAPRPGPRYSLGDLVQHSVEAEGYQSTPLAFPVLAPALKKVNTQAVVDLGPILWKAAKETEVARTFWLLSRDLLKIPNPAWLNIQAEPAAIADLAQRAALILSLANPWLWRGRYEKYLRDCYKHLLDCLLNYEASLENSAISAYVKTIHQWYRFFSVDDRINNIYEILQTGNKFLLQATEVSQFQTERDVVGRLIEIGEYFYRLDINTRKQWDRRVLETKFVSLNTYLQDVANSQVPIDLPSTMFFQHLRRFSELHYEWRAIQDVDPGDRPKDGALVEILHKYLYQMRKVHAPAHEKSLLHWAFHEDISRIEKILELMEIGPLIQVRLRNPWVVMGKRERLTFEVENVGGASASNFTLEMVKNSGFDSLSPLNPLPPKQLSPGVPIRMTCEIRAKEPTLNLQFRYRFTNYLGHLYENQAPPIRCEVHQPQNIQMKPRGNPYELSRPVYGSGKFFGRQNELERILTALAKGSTQPTLLHGPRRAGKTSLLRQLELILNKREELFKLNLVDELVMNLRVIHPIFVSLQSLVSRRGNFVTAFLFEIVQEIYEKLELPADTSRLVRHFERYSPAKAFIRAVDNIFQQRPRERVVLLIDEWDEVYHPEMSQLGKNLRYLLQREQRISWIFSSTWIMAMESRQFSSPFFSQLYSIPVKKLSWNSALELVTRPSSAVGLEWYGDAVVTVLEQTGQRPHLLQLVCSKTIDYFLENAGNIVDQRILSSVLNQILHEPGTTAHYFGFFWDDRQASDKKDAVSRVRWMGRLILWFIATHPPHRFTEEEIYNSILAELKNVLPSLPPIDFLQREFSDQKQKLDEIFDAIECINGQYMYGIPLVERWMRQMLAHRDNFLPEACAGLYQDWQEENNV